MKPEERARQMIDDLLAKTGWVVQDLDRMNLDASLGVAVREFPLPSGAADYLLFIDYEPVGIVEAKKIGHALIGVEEQSAKYLTHLPPTLETQRSKLPFSYESNSIETRFTNHLDPEPRSRQVFAFHRPEILQEWLSQAPFDVPNEQNDTLRARLLRMPALPPANLRECQIEAITNLEQSLALNKRRALIQMATGSGKTYTSVSEIYRLIKFAGAKRVVFLVDRADLGRQALNEFQQYQTPDDGRRFTDIYNVQHLQHNRIDPVARVCITTVQRLYSMLSGEPELDPALEEQSLFDLSETQLNQPPREVSYNPAIPIETFDFIFTDECHRSIYNLWRGVLEYFDAFIIGLTATPNGRTYGFFDKNLVMEYGHARAVADGVNVDYQVYRIRTAITEQGSSVEPYEFVGRRNRQTRKVRWEQLDDELTYDASRLDRDVVTPDQIRTVLQAYKDAYSTQLFPGRTEVPKTLIFAKDDNHAEMIVDIVRDVFAKGNQFAQKITYKVSGVKPGELIQSFRNSYYPRIAVTVDMISTGTDIKPLEVLLFMRSVKSELLFEQMKGRGTRVIRDDDFQAVTPGASKTHFVLIDAVGICERIKTDEQPLERNASVPFKALLMRVVQGNRDEATLSSLIKRLGRLAKRVSAEDEEAIKAQAGGRTVRELANVLVDALDPDKQLERVQRETGNTSINLDDPAAQPILKKMLREAGQPFSNPDLRTALLKANERDEQILDVVSQDNLISANWDSEAEEQARQVVNTFQTFIEQNQDRLTAIQIFYSRPHSARLRYEDVKQLAEAIAAPPIGLSTAKLWQAYTLLDQARVRGKSGGTIGNILTNLVSLVRYTVERDTNEAAVLEPYSETVARRFTEWLNEQTQQRGTPFTPEQLEWLELIRDHVANSLTIETDDFDYEPFNQRGGLGNAYKVFGNQLTKILEELNERLAA